MTIEFRGKRIESALFDMDGTMFDTERLRFDTLRQASREIVGVEIEDRTLYGSLGLSARRAESLAKAHYGEDYPYAAVRRRADELELEHVRRDGVPVKGGLVEILERFRRSGLSMAVATSSRRAIAEEYLVNANVLRYFDLLVCGDEVRRGKPDPEIFRRAALSLGRAPEECLMIEDSENGVRSAYAAGGQVILVRDIKRLDPEVEAVAARVYDSLAEFLHELGTSVPKLPVPLLTETFPQTPNAHRVGIHGFGAMGGGFLAQVFSHWDGYTKPRELIGVTGDALLRDAVNSFGKMSVRYGRHAFDQTIPNVRLVPPSDVDAVVGMYRDSRVVALAIPEQAVAVHAPLIAAGLLARQRGSGEPLSVLVVMNKVGGGRFVREQVESELAAMTDPPECERVLAATEFCETVVSRVVSRVDRDALLRQIRIRCDVFERNLAAVQQERGGTDPPTDPATEGERGLASLRKASEYAKALNELHLVPFTSEADMNLFADSKDPVVRSLRQVVIVDDMPSIQTIKNRVWNGTHAIIAWYAAMLGYPSIGQAMTDAAVIALVRQLIDCEITPAIEAENPHLGRAVHAFMAPFIDCCRMSFLDPVQRVGRDPLRKLQRDERIVGSIFAAAAHGIPTPALEYALAVALRYALSERCGDDQECALIRELYERDPRPEGILTYTGSYNGGAYLCLDPDHDAPLIARVVEHFVKLGDTTGEHWRWPLANA